jgi:hypothetical protein
MEWNRWYAAVAPAIGTASTRFAAWRPQYCAGPRSSHALLAIRFKRGLIPMEKSMLILFALMLWPTTGTQCLNMALEAVVNVPFRIVDDFGVVCKRYV